MDGPMVREGVAAGPPHLLVPVLLEDKDVLLLLLEVVVELEVVPKRAWGESGEVDLERLFVFARESACEFVCVRVLCLCLCVCGGRRG